MCRYVRIRTWTIIIIIIRRNIIQFNLGMYDVDFFSPSWNLIKVEYIIIIMAHCRDDFPVIRLRMEQLVSGLDGFLIESRGKWSYYYAFRVVFKYFPLDKNIINYCLDTDGGLSIPVNAHYVINSQTFIK